MLFNAIKKWENLLLVFEDLENLGYFSDVKQLNNNIKIAIELDDTQLTAIMVLPYFILTFDDKSKIGKIVQELYESSEMLVVSVEENKIHVKIKYDFGSLLGDKVWGVNSTVNNYMSRFGLGDDSITNYVDQESKKAIFNIIKEKYLSPLLKTLQTSAIELQEQWSS